MDLRGEKNDPEDSYRMFTYSQEVQFKLGCFSNFFAFQVPVKKLLNR